MAVTRPDKIEQTYGLVCDSVVCSLGRRQTLEEVIQLAVEIAREGREGRKIGTLFVVGSVDEVIAQLPASAARSSLRALAGAAPHRSPGPPRDHQGAGAARRRLHRRRRRNLRLGRSLHRRRSDGLGELPLGAGHAACRGCVDLAVDGRDRRGGLAELHRSNLRPRAGQGRDRARALPALEGGPVHAVGRDPPGARGRHHARRCRGHEQAARPAGSRRPSPSRLSRLTPARCVTQGSVSSRSQRPR